MKWNALCLVVVAAVCVASGGPALAYTYVVDAKANAVGTNLLAKQVRVELTSAGDYTFTLTASDFRENALNPTPQRHVVVNSAGGDNRTFALNGVGDSRTINFPNPTAVQLFFIDSYSDDNTGNSTVDVQKTVPPTALTPLTPGQTPLALSC